MCTLLYKRKSVDIAVLEMLLLNTRYGKDLLGTFLSNIVLHVLSVVTENESENIGQHHAEEIVAAGVCEMAPSTFCYRLKKRRYVDPNLIVLKQVLKDVLRIVP